MYVSVCHSVCVDIREQLAVMSLNFYCIGGKYTYLVGHLAPNPYKILLL